MCVTNIVKRHPRPVGQNVNNSMVSKTPSLISQRLMGNFMPLLNKTREAELSRSVPTMKVVPPQPEQNTLSQSSYNVFSEQTQNCTKYDSSEEKTRPKRRRKPQKPGKTAKMNDRHFVVHNYHDHALDDPDEHDEEEQADIARRGGVSVSFPMKLHTILDQVEAHGLGHIVSWQKHGRCFVIHKTKEFTDHVMPHYFRQTKLTSFQRQLNLYGFCRLTRGPDAGGYYHELFLRGKVFLAKRMQRTKIKGTKFKAASSPEQEPDFYCMPPVVVTPSNSSDDSSHDGQMQQVIARKKSPQVSSANLHNAFALNMDPMALQAPISNVMPRMEPNPMFPLSQVSFPQGAGFSSFFSSERGADQTLDEAVDELFFNAPEMSDLQQLDEMWDNTEFGEDKIQDDLQLGYMLESLLE